MKKVLVFIFILLSGVSFLKAQDVYKTPSGQKYHLGSCHTVKNVSEKITLSEAQRLGLEPCKICKPGNIGMNAISDKTQVARGQNSTVQCKGVTKKGTRCQHMTSIGNGYCFQHGSNR